MLPSLAGLSLVATGAKGDVNAKRHKTLEEAWEEAEEEQEMEKALAPALAELRAKEEALREEYRAEKRAVPVRKEVFDKEDLVREILLALRNDVKGWEICKMVVRWCSIDKARRAACDNDFWDEMSMRIWGEASMRLFPPMTHTGQQRFEEMCKTERDFRRGTFRDRIRWQMYRNVKRFVLAAIAASTRKDHRLLRDVSEALRDDEDVVRAAVRKNILALVHASPRLQALGKQLLQLNDGWKIKDPTAFQLKWSTDVMLLLLTESWTTLTVREIGRRLMEDAYFYAHKPEVKDLVNTLMGKILELRAEGTAYYFETNLL